MSGILSWLDWVTWDSSPPLNNSYTSIKSFINILLHAMYKIQALISYKNHILYLIFLCNHSAESWFRKQRARNIVLTHRFCSVKSQNATQNILHNLLKVALWKFPPLSDDISVNDVHTSCGMDSFSERRYLFCRFSFVSARLQSQQSVDVTKH